LIKSRLEVFNKYFELGRAYKRKNKEDLRH
jgi:hypothetical protein